MKTTIDLPDALVREIKLRAVYGRRKLKDEVADLLRKGLNAPADAGQDRVGTVLARDEQTGLPIIVSHQAAEPGEQLSPERIAQILIDQEADWHNDAAR
jgi:hypothetical protein